MMTPFEELIELQTELRVTKIRIEGLRRKMCDNNPGLQWYFDDSVLKNLHNSISGMDTLISMTEEQQKQDRELGRIRAEGTGGNTGGRP